jgi:hypothetical protein
VPLDDSHPKVVVFIVGWRQTKQGKRKGPIGTGFIVRRESEGSPGRIDEYVVTAAHGVLSGAETWVRFNTLSGGTRDEPVAKWFTNAPSDVAVAPLDAEVLGDIDYRAVWFDHTISQDSASRHIYWPTAGDPVFFIGLLDKLSAMDAANVPMVRGGTLGRLYQPDVPFGQPDGSIWTLPFAHLIDCRSYAGFSGSPCFVEITERSRDEREAAKVPRSTVSPTQQNPNYLATLLLGLVSGHFDDWSPTREKDTKTSTDVQSRVNTGVGLVTPADDIREILNDDEELMEMRAKADAEASRPDDSQVAVPDSLGGEPSEFAEFEALTEKLLRVPKKELDDKLKEA